MPSELALLSKPDGRHFRSKGQTRFAAVYGWITATLFLLMSLGAAERVAGVRVILVLTLGVVVSAFVLFVSRRYTRSGIYADDRGVTICNTLTADQRVPWQDIERFALEPVRADPGVATVYLVSGGSIRAHGLSQARVNVAARSNPTAEAINELNDLLGRSRTR